jgi:hypothetical protein
MVFCYVAKIGTGQKERHEFIVVYLKLSNIATDFGDGN